MAVTPNTFGMANTDTRSDVMVADRALFQRIYQSEILTSFEQSTIMLDKHFVRTITNGKGAVFPVMGRTSAAYHTIGAELTGSQHVRHNEKIIDIDGLLVSDIYVSQIEELMNYFDVRGPYAIEQGRALATEFDRAVVQEGVLGSAATSLLTTQNPAGGAITETLLDNTTLATRVGAVVKACFTAAIAFDNNNVPAGDRYLIVAPATYYDIVQNTDAINKDWGGAGAFSTGVVTEVAGIKILKSPNVGFAALVNGSFATGTNYTGGKHNVDMSQVFGLFFTPSAIGTVKLLDLQFESQWMINYQATLLVAKMAIGHGWLRPECLIRLIDSE